MKVDYSFKEGLVLFERTRILKGLNFTKNFIEFLFVERNKQFGSNSIVIWTQKTFYQRSSMAVGSTCSAIAIYFSVRICYMFEVLECRGE